jgi:hypothetical protein
VEWLMKSTTLPHTSEYFLRRMSSRLFISLCRFLRSLEVSGVTGVFPTQTVFGFFRMVALHAPLLSTLLRRRLLVLLPVIPSILFFGHCRLPVRYRLEPNRYNASIRGNASVSARVNFRRS